MHNLIETLSGKSNYAKRLSTASEHKLCVGKSIEFFSEKKSELSTKTWQTNSYNSFLLFAVSLIKLFAMSKAAEVLLIFFSDKNLSNFWHRICVSHCLLDICLVFISVSAFQFYARVIWLSLNFPITISTIWTAIVNRAYIYHIVALTQFDAHRAIAATVEAAVAATKKSG